MKNYDGYYDMPAPEPPQPLLGFATPQNVIAIYTVLSILKKMKNDLGLEAMHEYVEKYLENVERSNPRLRVAVEQALGLITVDRIYKDAVGRE